MDEMKPSWPASQRDEPRASFALLSFVMVFFAAAFFVNEVDWEVSTYENYAASPDDAEDQISTGNSSRKIAYVMMGAVGLAMLVFPGRRPISFLNLPFALLGTYVLVCMASFIWSDASWLTTKRLGTATFGLMAIVGVAKHLSARDIIDAAIGIGTILLVTSLYAELSQGTFMPWSAEYRFAGIVHPNTQGGTCGLFAIAAFFGMKASRRGKLVYLGFFLLAASFLILTKSRTAVAACLCGITAAWYLVASRRRQTLVGLGLPTAIGAVLLAMLLVGFELSSSATAAAQFGRGADTDLVSLNGRIPLWTDLIGRIAERPLLGHGYQGFWTPDRIYEISIEQEWTVPSAHSVFLDVLLSTGLVGGTVFALGILVTFHRTTRRCLETASATDCFVFAALVYGFIGAIFESSFSQPNGFEPFITGTALLRVMSRRSPSQGEQACVSHDADVFSDVQTIPAGGLASCTPD